MRRLSKKNARSLMKSDRFALYANEDCIEAAQNYLDDNSIDLIITDPPYGIGGDTLDKHYNRNESLVFEGYLEIPQKEYGEFSRRWIRQAARVLKAGGTMYVVSGWTNLRHLLNAIAETSLLLQNHIIWKYNFGVFTQRKFVTSHYHILCLVKPGAKPCFNKFSRFSSNERSEHGRSLLYADMEDVWLIPREYKTGQMRYKNELPKALLIKMLQYSSNPGQVVLDLFAGSFSTAKVAKAMERCNISFELSPSACQMSVPEVKRVKWGEMLPGVKTGKDDRPKQQGQPWTPKLLAELQSRYNYYRRTGLNKKETIALLQKDFARGYFGILNALKRGR